MEQIVCHDQKFNNIKSELKQVESIRFGDLRYIRVVLLKIMNIDKLYAIVYNLNWIVYCIRMYTKGEQKYTYALYNEDRIE